jgi:hypothetical protein
MAKRKKTASKSATKIVRVASAKPIIIRQNSGAVAKRKGGRRRRSSGGGFAGSAGKALMSSERIGAILGGFLLGVLDAKGTKLPTIPVLGRAGTAGVALYYLGRHMHAPLISHSATGFLSIAAYQMGNKGTVSGDAVVGDSVLGSDTI